MYPAPKAFSNTDGSFIISGVKGALDSIIEQIVEKIDSREVVEKSMNNMIKKLECAAQNNKVGARQPLSAPRKMKFTGRQQKAALRWGDRCISIFFHLHPNLVKQDFQITCKLFGLKRATLRTWLNNATFVLKWLPRVKEMTADHVVRKLPGHAQNLYNLAQTLG